MRVLVSSKQLLVFFVLVLLQLSLNDTIYVCHGLKYLRRWRRTAGSSIVQQQQQHQGHHDEIENGDIRRWNQGITPGRIDHAAIRHQQFQTLNNSGNGSVGNDDNDRNNETNSTRTGRSNNNVTSLSDQRNLQSNQPNFYWGTSSLGFWNYDVTIGNPLKGLSGVPPAGHPSRWPESLPSSLHHYKFELNQVMLGDPDVFGVQSAFNWTIMDQALELAAQFRSHVIVRFYVHYPGLPLAVPGYLLQAPYSIQTLWNGQEVVPWYGDPKLRRAFQQFIDHFSRRYDGDKRLLAIQAGLIGYWGEGHTLDCTYNWQPCDPDYTYVELVNWFDQYFKETQIQFRYPRRQDAYKAGFGFHDDSYTYETVSGPANGGAYHQHFFYNMSVVYNTSDAYKNGIIGGEVRPENSHVFAPYYPAGSEYHQDFILCTTLTRATYMDWSKGFMGGGVVGDELKNARKGTVTLGYNFILDSLNVASSGQYGKVDLYATIKQIGVAPFYYPLFLDIYCDNRKLGGQWIWGKDLSDFGSTSNVSLYGIPADSSCLNSVELKLGSTYAYEDRPIKWAQNINGKVTISIPQPPGFVETRTDGPPTLPRTPPPVQFPAPYIDGSKSVIGRCTVVCASMFCPGGYEMGDDMRGLQDGDKWSVGTTGNQLSIRCDNNAWNTDRMVFSWPGFQHPETSPPWSMGGDTNDGTTFFPVDYLLTVEHKTLTVIAYNGYNWLGARTMDFDLLP